MRHPFTHLPKQPAAAIEVRALLASAADRKIVEQCARDAAWQIGLADTIESATDQIASHNCAIFIVDRDCLEPDWRISVERLAKAPGGPCVVFVSQVVDRYLFDEVVKHGGFDIIPKPIDPGTLLRTARLAIAYWKSRHSARPINGAFNG